MTKNILYVLGAVFIILGLLGFVMDSPLFGMLEVNTTHNLIHLASGILAVIFAGMGEAQAKTFAVVLGVVYALVAVLGFLMGGNILGLMHTNTPAHVLHLILAVILLYTGLTGRSAATPSSPAM